MPQIKMKTIDGIGRKKVSDAVGAFLRRCRLKNLSPRTQEYYKEDLNHFCAMMPQIQYVNEITQDVLDDFVIQEMERNNRVSSVNTRLRGIYAFLHFCFEQEYAEAFPLSLLKEDEDFKDPYTDAELQKLLKQPKSDQWIEWRTWAAINLLVATGVRASTLVSIKISDVDLEQSIIRLRRLKNRKQQMVPVSSSLKTVLTLYLKTWDWDEDSYLFPNHHNQQLQPHSMGQAIREYNIARGVIKTSTHLFRHTFAKNYIMAGGGMVQLQSILGHSTLDMTRKYVNLYGNDIQRDFDHLNPLNKILAKAE